MLVSIILNYKVNYDTIEMFCIMFFSFYIVLSVYICYKTIKLINLIDKKYYDFKKEWLTLSKIIKFLNEKEDSGLIILANKEKFIFKNIFLYFLSGIITIFIYLVLRYYFLIL